RRPPGGGPHHTAGGTMTKRKIDTRQDVRELVLDTLGQYVRDHDISGLTHHIYADAKHDGTRLRSPMLDAADEHLIGHQPFWRLATRYNHAMIAAGRVEPGPAYVSPRHVSER